MSYCDGLDIPGTQNCVSRDETALNHGGVADYAPIVLGEHVDAAEAVVEVRVVEITREGLMQKALQRIAVVAGQLMRMTKPHPVSGCGFVRHLFGQCFSGPTWYSKTSPATAPTIANTRAIANQKFALANPIAKSAAAAAIMIGQ